MESTHTIYEVAAVFRCSRQKIASVALANGIGMQLGGSAGWRFTEADVTALQDAMRPAAAETVERKRRARRRAS